MARHASRAATARQSPAVTLFSCQCCAHLLARTPRPSTPAAILLLWGGAGLGDPVVPQSRPSPMSACLLSCPSPMSACLLSCPYDASLMPAASLCGQRGRRGSIAARRQGLLGQFCSVLAAVLLLERCRPPHSTKWIEMIQNQQRTRRACAGTGPTPKTRFDPILRQSLFFGACDTQNCLVSIDLFCAGDFNADRAVFLGRLLKTCVSTAVVTSPAAMG